MTTCANILRRNSLPAYIVTVPYDKTCNCVVRLRIGPLIIVMVGPIFPHDTLDDKVSESASDIKNNVTEATGTLSAIG